MLIPLHGAHTEEQSLSCPPSNYDHFKKRKPHHVSDLTVECASYTLTDKQFIAWKAATLQGLCNVAISDMMSTEKHTVMPSDVYELLRNASRRGFNVPGEIYPAMKPRIRRKEPVHA